MNVSSIIDYMIGTVPELFQTDVNGIIVRVTDWRYIACAVFALMLVGMIFYCIVTVVRIVGGWNK